MQYNLIVFFSQRPAVRHEAPGEIDDVPYYDDDDDYLKKNLDLEPEVKLHIGKNVFAVAKRTYKCVDIRENFFVDSNKVMPTTRGIYLKKEQFVAVADALQTDVLRLWKGLKDLGPCHLSHPSPSVCEHCFPRFVSKEEKERKREERKQKAISASAEKAKKRSLPTAAAALSPVPIKKKSPAMGEDSGVSSPQITKRESRGEETPLPSSFSSSASSSSAPKKADEKERKKHYVPDSSEEDEEAFLEYFRTRPLVPPTAGPK
jgi:hypothetical protein